METERKMLLEGLHNKSNHSDFIDIWKNYDPKNPKSAEASVEARNKGNDLLMKSKRHDAETHKAIFSHYCESIALAPMESQELALAFGNRSYLLLHMQKYEECIEDINRALGIPIPDVIKAKLLGRKAECRKRLGSSSVSSILKIVEIVAETVDDQDKIKVSKMIDAVNALDVGTKKSGMSIKDQKRKADNNLPVTDDYSSCISIEYSEKYGRQVLAAKDYKPGDIIFVEKMYASAFTEGSSLLACDHCQQHTWSGIPCSYCNWVMYCSENCKKEAWNEYHDIECSMVSQLKEWTKVAWKSNVLPLRILILGIKEAGGIANLKKEIELLDRQADGSRDFFKNGQFTTKSIRNVCSLACSLTPSHIFIGYANIVPYILISLAKYSKLKDDFNFKEFEDLEVNEDLMFLGSLFIKLLGVLCVNGCAGTHDKSASMISPDQNKKSMLMHCDKKRCLGIVYSLLNHSCLPSADWCCTESNKIIVYAVQPIKKHSQIFNSYRYGFENEFQSSRQAIFREKYNFTCECRACVEDWRPIKMAGDVDANKREPDVVKDITTGKFEIEDLNEVIEVVKERRQVDKSHIEKLSALIIRGMHWKHPSHLFCDLINILRRFFVSIYSPESLVFNDCY